MVIFLLFAAALWFGGGLMQASRRARLSAIAVLYVSVLLLLVLLPEPHPMRDQIGGNAVEWAVLGVAFALVAGYRNILGQLKRIAERKQQAPRADHDARGPAFSEAELERYARHITLPEIGGAGQVALKNAKVLVVGAGGLGAPALLYLAAAGVGRIGVIDHDTVSLSNLQRQIIHSNQSIDLPKVFSAMEAISALNPEIQVRPYNRQLTEQIAPELFEAYDLILDGTDSYEARAMVNRAAFSASRPVIAGAISAWEGQITLYDPANGAPCLACIFSHAPPPGAAATCAETGVIGALPGVIGTMMALEAIKEICHVGQGLRGRMLLYDGLSAEVRSVSVSRDPGCAVCGAR